MAKRTRVTVAALAATTLFIFVNNSLAAEPTRPNIVFIMADDLGWADVGFHGGNAPTPNLDKLAANNLELTRHYVAPVCSPTRTGLLTGRYWSRFDVTTPTNDQALPINTVTLPRAMKAAGYATCLVGKWHLGSKPIFGPNHYGFDHAYGSLAGGVGPYVHLYKRGPVAKTWHRNEKLFEEEGHVTDLLTNEATQWLEGRDENPFMLYVAYTAVHLPVNEPQEWLDRVPASIPEGVPKHYAACIMHLDDAVGKILATLDKTGKRKNTLLVFTSDNGGSTAENNDTRYVSKTKFPQGKLTGNNQPLRGGKGHVYEGGIRVPTIVSWPGKVAAGNSEIPMHIVDWMPTFCGIAGYQAKEDLRWDGRDVTACLDGTREELLRPLYCAGGRYHESAIMHGDWKLVTRQQDGKKVRELFNLTKDPNEKQDQADQQPERVDQMIKMLDEISKADGESAVGHIRESGCEHTLRQIKRAHREVAFVFDQRDDSRLVQSIELHDTFHVLNGVVT